MGTPKINFKVTDENFKIIHKIAKRAVQMADVHGVDYPMMDAHMDLTATHMNGNPLRLADLLVADDANFAHDVFGIRRHINRRTGQLENCFVPRFSQHQEKEAKQSA